MKYKEESAIHLNIIFKAKTAMFDDNKKSGSNFENKDLAQ